MTESLKVTLSGNTVGYLLWDKTRNIAIFQYDDDFVNTGVDIAPICMPLNSLRSQKGLTWKGYDGPLYKGLPPTFADSLPDNWGSMLFNKWIEKNHLSKKQISPLDHLAFIGSRSIGALEYEPALPIGSDNPTDVNIQSLYDFSLRILEDRESVVLNSEESILWQDLVKISTSAGGKRPKAIIAINEATGQVMSGQGKIRDGFKHYILKYDDGADFPYAKMEYVFYMIAKRAGIKMMPSHLRRFGNVMHFLTERFDRNGNEKIHTQTLAAMAPEADCYEDIFAIMRKLNVPHEEFKQLFLTMVLNVIGGNVDDHNKNFSFFLDKKGKWHLAPAYDLTYCINPSSPTYLNRHELSINGKKDNITKQDLLGVGKNQDIYGCSQLYSNVVDSLGQFPCIAEEVGIDKRIVQLISRQLQIV